MPADIPPKGIAPRPLFTELPAGSFLWRVTKEPVSGPTTPFRSPPADPADFDQDAGGRFGPTPECPYPYCYAALDDLTAISEVLLRNVGFGGPQRYLPAREITGRRLALLETRAPLWLVSLTGAAELAAACQDAWLIHAESGDYRVTQRWAHWLRDSSAPDGHGPAGLVWPSKRHPGGHAVLLFGDRCADAIVWSGFGARRLDDETGLDWLNLRLALLRTKVRVKPIAASRGEDNADTVRAHGGNPGSGRVVPETAGQRPAGIQPGAGAAGQ